MLFIISIGILLIVLGFIILEKTPLEVTGVGSLLVGTAFVLIMVIFTPFSYLSHISDLGVLREQQHVIQTYRTGISRLENRIKNVSSHKINTALLNHDSPITSLVSALSEAESKLVEAETKVAYAKVNIGKRKIGPFSFIVSWVGEK